MFSKDNNEEQRTGYVLKLQQALLDMPGSDEQIVRDPYLLQITSLSPSFLDTCKAYLLLTYYFKNESENPSALDQLTVAKLKEQYVAMSQDATLNWFGTPTVANVRMYQGQGEYAQTMQVMIAHLGNHLAKAGKAIKEEATSTVNFDREFLQSYVDGTLDAEGIKALDQISEKLWFYKADFFSTQATLHLYRFLLLAKNNKKGGFNDDDRNFITPRTRAFPLQMQHEDIDTPSLAQRVEDLLPDGLLKDLYIEDRNKAEKILNEENAENQQDKALTIQFSSLELSDHSVYYNFIQNLHETSPGSNYTARTLLGGHYESHMLKLMEQFEKENIDLNPHQGFIPYYDEHPAQKKVITFGYASYDVNHKWNIRGEIYNYGMYFNDNPHSQMLPGMNEQWEGEVIYKHLNRLYIISILADDIDVAEEARRRLEWWYDNVMPVMRGSAAVSESLSKAVLISHNIVPTPMINIFPDLGATFDTEENFVKLRYPEYYSDHNNQLIQPANREEMKMKTSKEEHKPLPSNTGGLENKLNSEGAPAKKSWDFFRNKDAEKPSTQSPSNTPVNTPGKK